MKPFENARLEQEYITKMTSQTYVRSNEESRRENGNTLRSRYFGYSYNDYAVGSRNISLLKV